MDSLGGTAAADEEADLRGFVDWTALPCLRTLEQAEVGRVRSAVQDAIASSTAEMKGRAVQCNQVSRLERPTHLAKVTAVAPVALSQARARRSPQLTWSASEALIQSSFYEAPTEVCHPRTYSR
jgi:hypothetical protein